MRNARAFFKNSPFFHFFQFPRLPFRFFVQNVRLPPEKRRKKRKKEGRSKGRQESGIFEKRLLFPLYVL